MNLSDIERYITARIPASLEKGERRKHINEIYLDLSRAFTGGTVSSSTVVGSTANEYALTWDARQVFHVLVETTVATTRLKKMDKEAFLRPYTSGTPTRWAEFGATQSSNSNRLQILLNPTPTSSATIHVEYEPTPAELTADNDVPAYIPLEYHSLIAYGAMALIASREEDTYRASMWEARYRDGVNQMLLSLGLIAPQNYPAAVVK